MNAAWHFKKITRLFSARNRRVGPIARTVHFRPSLEAIEQRTLLSTVAGLHQDSVISQTNNAPVSSFIGNFDGKSDLVTANSAANDLTMISGYDGPDPVTTTLSSRGVDPRLGFVFAGNSGLDNLVVGNAGDGVVALFVGTPNGLEFKSSVAVRGLPRATELVLVGVTGDQVRFYVDYQNEVPGAVSTLSLVGGSPPKGQLGSGSNGVAQLVPLQDSSLALIGTLLPQTVDSSIGSAPDASEPAAAPSLASASASAGSFGQPLLGQGIRLATAGAASEQQSMVPGKAPALPGKPNGAPWQSYMLGTDEAIERFDRAHPDLSLGASDTAPLIAPGVAPHEGDPAKTAVTVVSQDTLSTDIRVVAQSASDHVIDRLDDNHAFAGRRGWWREDTTVRTEAALAENHERLSACLLLTSVGAGCLYLAPGRKRVRASGRKIEARRRQAT
jgi:hypothetical protein